MNDLFKKNEGERGTKKVVGEASDVGELLLWLGSFKAVVATQPSLIRLTEFPWLTGAFSVSTGAQSPSPNRLAVSLQTNSVS